MDNRVRAGHLLIECLQRLGTRYLFGVPAETLLPMLDGLYGREDINAVVTRHEEGAAMAAEAYAKATGTVGVCFGERTVAAAHMSIGIHTAQQDSTPLVALIGMVPRSFEHREALQQSDVVAFLRPVTKWAARVDTPDLLPELLTKAFLIAASGRPGPVALVLPEDVLYAETTARPVDGRVSPAVAAPDPTAVRQAAEVLAAAERPVILAGGGVLRSRAHGLLGEVAGALSAPVYAAWRRNDVFPNDHDYYLGATGLGVQPDMVPGLRDADAVLAVGTRLSDATTAQFRLPSPGARLIRLDTAPEMSCSPFPCEANLVGDAQFGLETLLREVERQGGVAGPRRAARREWIRELRESYVRWSTPRASDGSPVDPENVMAVLRSNLDADTVVVADAGNFGGWLARYYWFRQAGTFFGPTAAGMGYAIPACIGVKLACPDRTVVGVAGDGGFLMTACELETASRLALPFVLLVFNNAMYGAIRALQDLRFPGRAVATEFGDSDLSGLAGSLGCYGERVERDADLAPALQRALASGRPAVLDLVMRRDRLRAYA